MSVEAEAVVDVRRPSVLRRITGDEGVFLRETWGRRAVAWSGADAHGFGSLLTFDDVDRILSTMSLRTPMFRLVKAGTQIPESAYTRSGRTGSKPVSGMADPRRIFELFGQGATIVLQGLHRYREPVSALVRDLEVELGHPCQVNAYITPPGAQGLTLHSDPHDVFVLQSFGRKHWEVHAAPGEEERPPISADVGPGDSIYMPTGTPHAATTQESLSGHLTVGVHVTSWRDVLSHVWKRVEADASLDDPIPAGWPRAPDAFEATLRDRVARAADALDGVDVSDVWRERLDAFLSSRSPLLAGTLVDQLRVSSIGDDSLLRRRPGSVCEVRRDGSLLVALLGDRKLEMPAWVEPAMRRVASVDVLRVGDLELGDARSRAVLARRLVREGLLAIVD